MGCVLQHKSKLMEMEGGGGGIAAPSSVRGVVERGEVATTAPVGKGAGGGGGEVASPPSIHPPSPTLVKVRETGGTFAKLEYIFFNKN